MPTPVYRLPYRFLVVYFAAIAALVWGFGCNSLARWGGTAAGAGGGALLGGPLGAAGGAVAGDAIGDALVPEEPQPTTVIHNAAGGTVNTRNATSEGGILDYWQWIVVGVVAFRFRHGLIALLRNIMSGAFGAAGMTSLGILLGGKASEKAKEMTAAAVGDKRRRRAGIPITPMPGGVGAGIPVMPGTPTPLERNPAHDPTR